MYILVPCESCCCCCRCCCYLLTLTFLFSQVTLSYTFGNIQQQNLAPSLTHTRRRRAHSSGAATHPFGRCTSTCPDPPVDKYTQMVLLSDGATRHSLGGTKLIASALALMTLHWPSLHFVLHFSLHGPLHTDCCM